jgi:glucose/arabinose dehydrogenase/cytochrome c2
MRKLAALDDATKPTSAVGRVAAQALSAAVGAPCAVGRWLARRPILATLLAVVLLGGVAAASAGVGYWAAEHDVPQKIQARYIAPRINDLSNRLGLSSDFVEAPWRTVTTNGQLIDIAKVSVFSEGQPMVWALAEAGDNIIFSSRHGQLNYLNPENRIVSLGVNVPQRFDLLRESGLLDDPIFDIAEIRTFDILTVPTAEGAYDLYASYARYKDNCIEVAVSRTALELTSDGVRPATGEWEDVYVVNPCIAIKSTGMRFAGHEAGGRLALLDPDTLLLSVGVFQMDNVALGQLAGQDNSIDLGKIIEIKLSTREARIYAQGFRNPQGLLVASDGRVWETEHGPQGGDEVNLIREGANYGWPLATYGMDYASPPRDWPFTRTPGRQDGYQVPAFSFTPSIGISNIIEPDPSQFPRWKGQVLAASLSAQNLYVMRVVEDRIIAAEPISLATRLRDIIQLRDGRIAVSSDAGDLIIIRNTEMAHEPGPFIVSGFSELAPPREDASIQGETPLIRGARLFFYKCGVCHSLTGEVGIGPPLNGVVGRPIASVEDYGYSPALRERGGSWTGGLIASFADDPQGTITGTVMPKFEYLPGELELVVRYLASTKAGAPDR